MGDYCLQWIKNPPLAYFLLWFMIYVNSEKMNPWIFLWESEGTTNNKDYAGDIIIVQNLSAMPQSGIHTHYLNILTLNAHQSF
jgi:hypothetical protein